MLKPTKAEIEFLNLAYNRFLDLYEEITAENFYEKDSKYRFFRFKESFSVYTELLSYEPIKHVLMLVKKQRPPMEGEISENLFKFIRNVVIHFPFFDSWEDVWVRKDIINWNTTGKSIDKFLQKYVGRPQVKYRVWSPKIKKMTYMSISFPNTYQDDVKIYLKDILTEKEGILFAMVLMKQILMTQVEEIKEY